MNLELEQSLPEQWRGPVAMLLWPMQWILPIQRTLLEAAGSSELWQLMLLKRIFLLLPALMALLGLWSTLLAFYSLPFRSERNRFLGTLLVLWWDMARCTWLFWAGMFRFLWVAFGSLWGLIHLIVQVLLEIIYEIFELPFVLTGTISRNLRQPGVPWLACLMTVFWSVLEATIFTYVLAPTVGEIMSDLTGAETHLFLKPLLFAMLFLMIAGSMSCMYVLVEATAKREIKQIVQMLIVEFFVMFVEVMFLYREMVDALTPWIAQQTGMQMGIVPVLMLASFCWLGVRGMTWFLFARYGTPTLLALISRQRLPEEAEAAAAASKSMAEERWERVVSKLKNEQTWFQDRAQALLEAAILPSFQVIASGLNFGLTLLLSRPLFSLPFKNLGDVGETKTLLQAVFGGAKEPA